MAAIERLIPGEFTRVPGGYSRQVSKDMIQFIPDCGVASFIPETGTLYGFAPDYDALEAAKAPSVHADKPGEYTYYYEQQKPTTGCDFSADLAYYGKHYYLRPLRDDLPRLHGRGITYDEKDNDYCVTIRAYEKLCQQYKISRERCFD